MGKIVLIGYMGAGKTTVGKVLARQIGYGFCDLDEFVESRIGRSIPEIFAEEGEGRFRDMEREALRDACLKDSVVIAVGGGTPCFFDNMDFMIANAVTVYLKASVDTIIEHIHISTRFHGSNRPLLQGMDDTSMREFISQNLCQREEYYSRAEHTIDIATLRTEEQIGETAKKIQRFL